MASLFSHPAWPVGIYLSRITRVSKRLFWVSMLLTILPDADVIAFRFGIPYASPWGHRGFTHSIFFAFLLGLVFTLISKTLKSSRIEVFIWTFTSTLSHAIFDAFTNGGLGVALLWPISNERYFFPWRPVEVSPIGVVGFLSFRGVVVVISEILWIWMPCIFLSFTVRYFSGRKSRP